MDATKGRQRSNSSTPMLNRNQPSSSSVKGNDRDNGGEDDDIVLQPFTSTQATDKTNHSNSSHTSSIVSGAPAFMTISLDSALQQRLIRYQRRVDLASSRLANIISRGGDAKQALAESIAATTALSRLQLSIDPAYLFHTINDDVTRNSYARYQREWEAYQKATKESGHKHFHNLAAGGVGNFICFGLGGIAGAYSGSWLVGFTINTVAWTFAEPLISMMRATTVNNPYMDFYMVRQRLQARALRERLDGTADLEWNRKFPWSDRGSNQTEWLNASEWLERTSWQGLWAGKHFTDDVIYHVYSVMYGLTNCLPEFLGKALYDMSTWHGKLAYGGIRAAGGFIAGAVIQEGMQLLRASAMEHTGGKETVTKPLAFWEKEANYVDMLLERIKDRLAAHGLDVAEKSKLEQLKASLLLWHQKAVAKSSFLPSLAYEWRVMLQSKREATGIDPEVPGKRLDTLASFIGKGVSQLPGIAVGQLAGSAATRSALPWVRWSGYIVPPLVSIAWGFCFRREFEVVARAMLGAGQGIARRCCFLAEQDDTDI
ncbi:hypothetical protein KTQ42_13440|uniref:hypothetical protein n=1 Tax=Noviherbaspirillum sp. L7-7A TaxID=2850560 RepID=UPI001C2BA519|nr:hypothetical protein [Noviherbaspirillum sp. L7-7A]MBV0880309.1 hypothetical protein [Noviherbaspirillum sp. L7-7A]